MAGPDISIGDGSIVEGFSDTRKMTFDVMLSEPSTQQVKVSYKAASGTAKIGSDFQSRSGMLTFRPGQTRQTIAVNVNGDKTVELDEVFFVHLSRPLGGVIVDDTGAGTIVNDDFPPPTATVADLVVEEERGEAIFTVHLNYSGVDPVTLRYATKAGTASASDFAMAKGALTFAPGEVEKQLHVPLVNDSAIELAEQFTLIVSTNAPRGKTLATATATIIDTDQVAAPEDPRLVGYFPSWRTYDRDYQVMDVPAEHLTHVIYAFAGISAKGTIQLEDPYADIQRLYGNEPAPKRPTVGYYHGNFRQLQLLKEAHPHLQTLLSVGGWLGSARFSDVAATAAARKKFVGSVVRLLADYGFDGVDLDWEFPVSGGLPGNRNRPADRHNFTLLAQEFRKQFDARESATGKHPLMTIALGTQPEQYANYELRDLARFADWVHLMTYDYNGPASGLTGHNSPLYASPDDPNSDTIRRTQFNVDASVDAFLNAGLTPGKLVIGAAFYGQGWSGVADINHGLFQAVGGLPQGTWEDAGSFEYYDIESRLLPQMTRHWDDAAKVPWLYDPVSQIMIGYDDPESLGYKARFVRDRGLGGMMMWELSGDDDEHSLVRAIEDNLRLPLP